MALTEASTVDLHPCTVAHRFMLKWFISYHQNPKTLKWDFS